MIARNRNFADIEPSYLFSQVRRKKEQFQTLHPKTEWLPLGIGDTTEPLAPSIIEALHECVRKLGNRETYIGYGPDLGISSLREAIAKVLYNNLRASNEIIISDGAKCDLGRLQILFGSAPPIAVLDPAYPVYYDSSFLLHNNTIQRLAATKENDFFPDIETVRDGSIIFLCSPNNPTGKVFTKNELSFIVQTARSKKCLILFDVAYRSYIQSEDLPRSIFEIPGADEVAIEIGSFSKMAGFSGLRLGWMALSKKLTYDTKEPILNDLARLMGTLFNGASIISQHGGIAALLPEGQAAIQQQVRSYMTRARKLKETLLLCQVPTYGGEHAPYVWIHPNLGTSWDAFDLLLSHGIISTPGIGFGPNGEGYLRLSSFAKEEYVEKACIKLRQLFLETKGQN